MLRKLRLAILILKALLLSAGLILTVSLTWFFWHEKANFESGLRATSATIREVGLTAKNLREASDIWKKASADQSSAVTSAARNVSAAAQQLSGLSSALESQSTALLSELTKDASAQNTALLLNQRQFQKNLAEIQAVTGDLRSTLSIAE